MIDEDPTLPIRSIKRDQAPTMPLSLAQFKQLIEATYRYDEDRRRDRDKFGVDLRAIFRFSAGLASGWLMPSGFRAPPCRETAS
jgi:hypothetical protein